MPRPWQTAAVVRVEGLIGGTQGAADGIRNGWHEGSQSIADGRPWPGLRAFPAEFR